MRRSKKIFTAFAFAFFLLLVYVVYDISSRTTFPGSPKKDTPEASDYPDSISGQIQKLDTLK